MVPLPTFKGADGYLGGVGQADGLREKVLNNNFQRRSRNNKRFCIAVAAVSIIDTETAISLGIFKP